MPIPMASIILIIRPFLLAHASARQMIMQFTMIKATYGPRVELISGRNACRKRSAIVTKVAIAKVNIRIRRWGFRRFLIRQTTMLLHSSTNMTLSPIVRAGFTAAVTASVGHIPRRSLKTGFSRHSPARKVWLNTFGDAMFSVFICYEFPCYQLFFDLADVVIDDCYDSFAADSGAGDGDYLIVDFFGVACF